jgi:hypothetical protein
LAEFAADDCACQGDLSCGVTLAGSLVRIARFGAMQPHGSALEMPLLADDVNLSRRVDRLLSPCAPNGGFPAHELAWAATLMGVLVLLAAIDGWALPAVHELLERLIQ